MSSSKNPNSYRLQQASGLGDPRSYRLQQASGLAGSLNKMANRSIDMLKKALQE